MTKEKKNIPWKIIIAHLTSQATAEEESLLQSWVSDPVHASLYREIAYLYEEIQACSSSYTPNVEYYRKELDRRTGIAGKGMRNRKLVFPWIKIAASFLLLFALSCVFLMGRKTAQRDASPQLYSSVNGKSEILLPDGSSVWLNAGTQLKYYTSFMNDRRLEMSGEAFFMVKKDSYSPFIVSVGKLEVKVHGTTFNVRAYARDSIWKVALNEGSVSLRVDGNEFFMQPGEIASYNERQKSLHIGTDDVAFETFWANRSCTFEAKSLAYICRYLERWYGVHIEVDPVVAEESVYTFILTNEPLETILQIMSRINPMKYTFIDEKNINIEHVKPLK